MMGIYNSSVTRVWPVFDSLFAQDPSGIRWLSLLLALASEGERLTNRDYGPLLPCLGRFDRAIPGAVLKSIGSSAAQQIGKIRRAFEVDLPPPLVFLRWMIENPERLTWPRSGGKERNYDKLTQHKRRRLLAGDREIREEALADLRVAGSKGSGRKWWAFEGFTSVDCYLETDSLVLLIEGKRSEPVSAATSWYPTRNQVLRNLEVAHALAGGSKEFAVLLCSENKPAPISEQVWQASFPHLSPYEIEELKGHYGGHILWSAIAAQLCPELLPLPNTVTEAVALCRKVRGAGH